MIFLTIFDNIKSWIDQYANWYTFLGLIVGIIGLVLTIYFSKKQAKNAKLKPDEDTRDESDEAYLGVSVRVNHTTRNFVGYGASCGKVIQAGNFKANYEVEAELTIIIQNESPSTIYKVDVSYIPNSYSKRYTLVDSRQNKLQPLEGNKHIELILRIKNDYYDMYAHDVDKDIRELYKVGKDISILNGSIIIIKYLDSKHKEHTTTEVIA